MDKKYIFHYDKPTKRHAVSRHLLKHDGLVCSACIEGKDYFDHVHAVFDDGFECTAFVYELEEVNG